LLTQTFKKSPNAVKNVTSGYTPFGTVWPSAEPLLVGGAEPDEEAGGLAAEFAGEDAVAVFKGVDTAGGADDRGADDRGADSVKGGAAED